MCSLCSVRQVSATSQHGKGIPAIQLDRNKRGRRQEDLNISKAWAAFEDVRIQNWGQLFTPLAGISHFPAAVSLSAFSVYLVCSTQKIILQRCHLPPVLCNKYPKALAFHHVGMLSALNISSSMSWIPRWQNDLWTLSPLLPQSHCSVLNWMSERVSEGYMAQGSLQAFREDTTLSWWITMFTDRRGQNTPKEIRRRMMVLTPMFTVEQSHGADDLLLPFCTCCNEEVTLNLEASSAEAFLLFVNPPACFVGCSSRRVATFHCGHWGERLNEAKGIQTSRDPSDGGQSTWLPVGYWQQKLLMCTCFDAFLRLRSLGQNFVLALQSVASVSQPAARETHHETLFPTFCVICTLVKITCDIFQFCNMFYLGNLRTFCKH